MLPQFKYSDVFQLNYSHVSIGLTIFIIGLAKKIILADSLSVYASPVFSAAEQNAVISTSDAWVGSLAYSLQLYFDFSGYSDMAIGIARMFGIVLPLNFYSPYKANNIIDFWRRWHITLSRFLRDYLYIPLGGNRKGRVRRYTNLFITMLLGGLWHGASWNFVIWGGLHGLYLSANHLFVLVKQKYCFKLNKVMSLLIARLLTFLAILVAWVFFRAESFSTAVKILSAMIGLTDSVDATTTVNNYFFASLLIILGLVIVWFLPNTHQIMEKYNDKGLVNNESDSQIVSNWFSWKPNLYCSLIIGTCFFTSLLMINKESEFLYFNF